ncbi:MAG: biopolymer transporter ExbD [Verrucomicrobia bacterium]|nr:biopolymer transporter ExbD [Verrucomicrobiota bacterium]MBI3870645.1 biopolymer transporter ExbD [Verrucomicrobiota bacterium]
MRKASRHRDGHGTLAELNITPLLDLVFVLLVIFIISTPQLVNELELNLPTADKKDAPKSAPPKLTRIIVQPDGSFNLDGAVFTLESLRPKLEEVKAERRAESGEPNVVIRGFGEAEYQRVIDLLDLLQQLEITKIGLATDVLTPAGG